MSINLKKITSIIASLIVFVGTFSACRGGLYMEDSEYVGESYGAAVCIKTEGYLVTNAHGITYIDYENITREAIQSDITISAVNSGGALLDEKGDLIGIARSRLKTIKAMLFFLHYPNKRERRNQVEIRLGFFSEICLQGSEIVLL